jgi:hypothetical protein
MARYKCRSYNNEGEFASTPLMFASTAARRILKMTERRAERPGDEGLRGGMGAPCLRGTGKPSSGGSSSAAASMVLGVATKPAAAPVPRSRRIPEQGSDSANAGVTDRGGDNPEIEAAESGAFAWTDR